MQVKKGTVFWFTGLSGAGKTTLANLAAAKLSQLNYNCLTLDGDVIRKGLNKDLKFTKEDRLENNRRIAEVAKLLADAGLIVLVSCISPFKKDRELNKHICGSEHFFEIYIECPIEVCECRDVKGLYARARKGLVNNFTGIDSSYEVPATPDFIVRTGANEITESFASLSNFILKSLENGSPY